MVRPRYKSRKNKKRARGRRNFIKSEATAGLPKPARPELSALGRALEQIARRGDRGK